MSKKPATVKEYLAALPADRRRAVEAVRKVIKKNLDPRIKEGIQYGMIGYFVPHSLYPAGYHCDPQQPLPFASLASQKNHMAVYLMCTYMDPVESERLAREWKASGKRLDMGKSCLRFKKLEDVPLDVLGAAVKRMDMDRFVGTYEAQYGAARKAAPSRRKPAAKKTAAKKATTKKAAARKKPAAKKATAKKAAARKKPSARKKPAAKKATARKTPARKRAAR